MAPKKRPSILIINPNSTAAMTTALEEMCTARKEFDACDLYFTQPSTGPPSINNDVDGEESLEHCIEHLSAYPHFPSCDAYLVACYSSHPLVSWLRSQPSIATSGKPVLGIFEASVIKSLRLIDSSHTFGIVSTGKAWETLLSSAVQRAGGDGSKAADSMEGAWAKFAGVETTGLSAIELHDKPQDEVKMRLKDATKRLVKKSKVGSICLGCAGMAGMDVTVREALVEELGTDGNEIAIIDGVIAGVELLLEECSRA